MVTTDDQQTTTLDEELARFQCVNGSLFRDLIRIPSFNSSMRQALLDACHFDWSAISPAIFGALFQSVTQSAERRTENTHYTTEQNILKVIEPLFMDNLKEEFNRLKFHKDYRRRTEPLRFQRKPRSLTFLDPACGCGNTLIIACQKLCRLEIEGLKELPACWNDAGTDVLDVLLRLTVNMNQFHGIEKSEFPTRIAETAMWMMWPIIHVRLSLEFGLAFARIGHADALEMDWNETLPDADCSYVLSNPPFVGAKLQTRGQRAQVRRTVALGSNGGPLDYVAAWFLKAGAYTTDGTRIHPDVDSQHVEYRLAASSPYLIDAGSLAIPQMAVCNAGYPLNGFNRLIIGSKPIDGGHYIFNTRQHAACQAQEPAAVSFLRPYVGARKSIHQQKHSIMDHHDASPETLKVLLPVRELIATARRNRPKSASKPTLELATTPNQYHINVLFKGLFSLPERPDPKAGNTGHLVRLGRGESQATQFFMTEPTAYTDSALQTSAMHMFWVRYIPAQFDSRYPHSIGPEYQTPLSNTKI